MSDTRPTTVSGNVVVIAAVVMFLAVVAGVVCIALAVHDGARALSLIGLMLPALAAGVPSMLNLLKTSSLAADVASVKADTYDLTNGLGDAKARLGTADVLRPDLLHEDAADQLAADRVRVASRAGKHAASN